MCLFLPPRTQTGINRSNVLQQMERTALMIAQYENKIHGGEAFHCIKLLEEAQDRKPIAHIEL